MKIIKTKRQIYKILENGATVQVVAKCPKGCRWWYRADGIKTGK